MNPRALACLVIALAAPRLHAGPAEMAVVNAMKLPDAPNYSWFTDVADDARSYTIDGRTDLVENKDFSLVTMPMVGSISRRLGRDGNNAGTEATAIFKGDETFVLETPDGWKKSDELSRPNSNNTGGRGGFGGRGRGMRGRSGGMRVPGGEEGTGASGGTPTVYSNLQKTLSRPHEEIAIIVANYTELKAEPEGASGTLSDTGAKLLLVHAGQKEITPVRATGTFRLWLKNGALVKYEVKLEGTLALSTSNGRREVEVHQTATTTIRDVGTTKFDVPEAAKKKLGG